MRKTKVSPIIDDILKGFRQPILNASSDDLKAVIKRVNQFTDTNCGWSEYWLKSVIVKFCEDELRNRKLSNKSTLKP